ncbi:hypothetical protein MKX01_021850 [Papaver californicum]|nr:hypothetical protein MKX01_021850 [Papaver californicum]
MGKIELEVEIKSSPEKFWDGICDSTVLFPKIFPEQYKSIEIVEGDGKSVGTVRLVTYGEAIPIVTFAKEKIEVADETTKSLAYSVIDGEIAALFKFFTANLQISPKGDGSTIKFSVEFEKASDEVPDPDLILELAMKTFSEFDAYLLKA